MAFTFSTRSLRHLAEVHPHLQAVALRALQLTKVDFTVVDGKRTLDEQRIYVMQGKSKTMKSRHLGGFAIDYVAWVKNKPSYDLPAMTAVAEAFKSAAAELNVPIDWGGDWKGFRDTPHIELNRKRYPG